MREELKTCGDCGSTFSGYGNVCPRCGAPISLEQPDPKQAIAKSALWPDSPIIRFGIIFFSGIFLLCGCLVFITDREPSHPKTAPTPSYNGSQSSASPPSKSKPTAHSTLTSKASIEAVTNNGWSGSVSQVQSYLKRNLKDPSSYQSIEWSKVSKKDGGYTVRHKYRAKNSFGGYNVEERIFVMDSKGNVIQTIP